jgi:transcriptional regulator with XRE-family HTH domain
VDESTSFGDQLRRLRRERGMSLRDLGKLTHDSKTNIGDWETGKKAPTADIASRLDEVLDGGGKLAAAAATLPAANGNAERLAHVAAKPRTADTGSVDALAGILANMRRLEDSVGAGPLISMTAGTLRVVESLADEARGTIRKPVVNLAGQWAQFAGWLRAATGQPGKAREWYARTLEHATEVGNRDLIATSLSMRGNLAWMARQPGPVVGLSVAAARHADSPGVRAMAEQQEARGHAVLGDADRVEELLDLAEVDMAAAADHPEDEPAWIYFYSPGYLKMQRGLAYRLLDRRDDAIAALTAGLAATGEDVKSS